MLTYFSTQHTTNINSFWKIYEFKVLVFRNVHVLNVKCINFSWFLLLDSHSHAGVNNDSCGLMLYSEWCNVESLLVQFPPSRGWQNNNIYSVRWCYSVLCADLKVEFRRLRLNPTLSPQGLFRNQAACTAWSIIKWWIPVRVLSGGVLHNIHELKCWIWVKPRFINW